MNGLRMSMVIAALATLALLGAQAVQSDPAASEDSAWSPLPQEESTLTDPLERRGQAVFHQRCSACHSPVPAEIFGPAFLPAMPGTVALQARYQGAVPAALEERTNLTGEFIRTVVRQGLPAMPFFRPTEVSNEDLEALVAYLTRSR